MNIKQLLKKCTATALTLATGLSIMACASFEDNLTGVPIASVNYHKRGKPITQFFVNDKNAGFNRGGYDSPLTIITLDKNFKGPFELKVKWKICNFRHFIANKKPENNYCIDELYESKVSVHVLNSPPENAYLYLHFFEDNSVEAWMVDNHPQSPDYPGPLFPRDIS